MFTRNVAASSSEAYALVSEIPAGTYNAYAKASIQPVRNPRVRPSPWLL